MPKRALITGISGQDGSYLAELLLEKGYEVHGLVRGSPDQPFERLAAHPGPSSTARGGPARRGSLFDVIRHGHPGRGLQPRRESSVSQSWRLRSPPPSTRRSASRGCWRPSATSAGGALLPGFVQRDVRQVRETPQNERRRSIRAAPTASRRSTGTSSPSTTARASGSTPARESSSTTSRPGGARRSSPARSRGRRPRSSSGWQTSCALGNLDARRDWGYAKEYVEAMWLMLQRGRADDFVIGTGVLTFRAGPGRFAFQTVGLQPRGPHSHRSGAGQAGGDRGGGGRRVKGATRSSAGNRGSPARP